MRALHVWDSACTMAVASNWTLGYNLFKTLQTWEPFMKIIRNQWLYALFLQKLQIQSTAQVTFRPSIDNWEVLRFGLHQHYNSRHQPLHWPAFIHRALINVCGIWNFLMQISFMSLISISVFSAVLEKILYYYLLCIPWVLYIVEYTYFVIMLTCTVNFLALLWNSEGATVIDKARSRSQFL